MPRYTLLIDVGEGKSPASYGTKEKRIDETIRLLKKIRSGGLLTRRASRPVCQVGNASATGTVTAAAVQSGDTVTLNGKALTAAQLHATGTFTFSTIVADNVCTINGVDFTAKASASGEYEFDLGASDTEAATNLAAKINACNDRLIKGVVTATSAAAVVTVRYATAGTAGNSIAIAKTGAPITVSAATLENGAAKSGDQFCFTGSNNECAQSVVDCVNTSTTTGLVKKFTAARASAVVTFTAAPGEWGNAVTLASSNGTRLAVSGAKLTGGSDTVDTW